MSSRIPDALIIGDGVIAYASALAIARSGGSCALVGRTVTGAASSASAGLLAPSIGPASQAFRSVMLTSRDLFPGWVEWLTDRTGTEIDLNRTGVIQVAHGAAQDGTAEVLDDSALRELEPEIAHDGSALFFRDDGYVNTVQLLAALRVAARVEPRISVIVDRVTEIRPDQVGCTITTEHGRQLSGPIAVIAAGAWSALIPGLPRELPVEPLRGQMLQLRGCPLRHALSSKDAYLVPRGDCTLVGSTLEHVGFENATTPTALERLHESASRVVPSLRNAPVHSAWAGLRPMTFDGMPIIGRDPEFGSIVYACGHGKNGILLAPITADRIGALVSSNNPPFDHTLFSIERFVGTD